MKASSYYKEWISQGSIRQRKSLRNIEAICNELEKEGIIIVGSIVGRLCKQKFGTPSYGSMKNNQVLMEYVRLRGMEQGRTSGGASVIEEALRLENRFLREFIEKHVGVKNFWV